MKFCTVINCMDGRVQLPVIAFLQKRFNATYVDSITEAGPLSALASQDDETLLEAILFRLNVSINKHHSMGIALVGHYDCAGNPVSKERQLAQMEKALAFTRSHASAVETIGLWVDENWEVHELYK